MELIENGISLFYSYLLGQIDAFYYVLIACVVLDYVSGVMSACVNKNLSSKIGAKGICKKILIFMIVGLSHTIDKLMIGEGSTLRTTITMFYIANESISILENAESIGLPIPNVLKSVLRKMENAAEEENHKTDK